MSTTKQAILPALGEFGCYVGAYVRQVNAMCRQQPTIVCCPLWDKALFPYAAGFFHDYQQDFIADDFRAGFYTDGEMKAEREVDAYLEMLSRVLQLTYPGVKPVRLGFSGFKSTETLSVQATKSSCVAIGMRCRSAASNKNLGQDLWVNVIGALKSTGVDVFAVGKRGSSLYIPDPDVSYMAYDSVGCSASIRVLARSSLFIGTDSGPAHLAALLGVPMLLIDNGVNSEIDFLMRHQNVTFVSQDEAADAALRAAIEIRQAFAESGETAG